MRTHQHHHLPAWGLALVVSGMLAATAAIGFALAMTGLAGWIFILLAAAAGVTAWLEGRPAARARAEAAALPGAGDNAGGAARLFSA